MPRSCDRQGKRKRRGSNCCQRHCLKECSGPNFALQTGKLWKLRKAASRSRVIFPGFQKTKTNHALDTTGVVIRLTRSIICIPVYNVKENLNGKEPHTVQMSLSGGLWYVLQKQSRIFNLGIDRVAAEQTCVCHAATNLERGMYIVHLLENQQERLAQDRATSRVMCMITRVSRTSL